MAAGERHTCAVTQVAYNSYYGDVYCWGDNADGQLGIDSLTGIPFPVRAELPAGLHLVLVTAGRRHSCALVQTGEAYCWGANEGGQLGLGDATNRRTPVLVTGGHVFGDLEAGAAFTCGLVSGAAYCWGDNTVGQLGDSSNASSSVPVPVVGSHTFHLLVLGRAHACGIDDQYLLWCWGDNASGQLGDGTRVSHNFPAQVIR
jgi:alpha-tubulin suppressor-like RCC1 family protein